MRDCAAIILAAGQGTRMKSDRSKVLHELAGLSMICYPALTAAKLKLSPIVVVVGHQGKEVEEALRDFLPKTDIRFVKQKNQLGTGHAVKQARKELKDFNGDVMILYGDVPLLSKETVSEFRKLHNKSDHIASVISIFLDNPFGYGRMLLDTNNDLVKIVEEKDASSEEKKIQEVNSGIYISDAKTLFKYISKTKRNNVQKEYYLTDAITLMADKSKVAVIPLEDNIELIGVNNRADLAMVTGHLRDMINEYWMRRGVTLLAPNSTYIDMQVKISRDVEIGPNVSLRGSTKIGKGCIIQTGSYLMDAVIDPGVHVKPYTVIENSKVATGSIIGPFSRIRPGTKVGKECKIGNFVELKKTTTGKNTKVSHLTYLGDAELGSNINIGAGTITCNYDGKNKFKTKIKSGAFIGSDSQLIAPVTIGERAYVGSGSTISNDVPPDALAVVRGKEIVKKGYAKRYLKKKSAKRR